MSSDVSSIVFRIAAGPRLGFGHLVRCRSLAHALGLSPVASVRGAPSTRRIAAAMGFSVVEPDTRLLEGGARVLVIDDPQFDAAASWVERGRRAGIPVATIHDLGLAYVDSDLSIDGSIEPRSDAEARFGSLRGPDYAILDPAVLAMREGQVRRFDGDVLVALGGGAHVYGLADDLTRAIEARVPGARIRVAAGFSSRHHRPPLASGTWVSAPGGLADELSRASVAIVAGGVTLYEACALGTPAIAVAVTPAQQIAIRAFARRGAALDGGAFADGPQTLVHVADHVARLMASPHPRATLSSTGRRLVDARGVFRVADALRLLYHTMVAGVSDAA